MFVAEIDKTPLNLLIAKQFMLIKRIGEGSFGEVYIARSIETNKEVAVKLVNRIAIIGKN